MSCPLAGRWGSRGERRVLDRTCRLPIGALHQALLFARPLALFLGIAFVGLLLAAPEAEFKLDAPALVMQVQRYQGETALFDLADQARDFFHAQQQLAGAHRVGLDVG